MGASTQLCQRDVRGRSQHPEGGVVTLNLGEVPLPFVTSQRAVKSRFLPDGAVLLDVPQHGDGRNHRPAGAKVTHSDISEGGGARGSATAPPPPRVAGRDNHNSKDNKNETKVEEKPAFLTYLVE